MTIDYIILSLLNKYQFYFCYRTIWQEQMDKTRLRGKSSATAMLSHDSQGWRWGVAVWWHKSRRSLFEWFVLS